MDETKTFQVIFFISNSSFSVFRTLVFFVLVCRWLAWIPTLYFVSLVACSFLDISLYDFPLLFFFLSLAFVVLPLPANLGSQVFGDDMGAILSPMDFFLGIFLNFPVVLTGVGFRYWIFCACPASAFCHLSYPQLWSALGLRNFQTHSSSSYNSIFLVYISFWLLSVF